jgi:regulator of sirC expression with transglutaminase-like and TPR domain
MAAASPTQSGARLSESQRAALLNLLVDDDPAIYRRVREKIISEGAAEADWLRAYRLHDDPVLRRRTQEIIRHFERQAADNRFLAYCLSRGDDIDVEEGSFLLARTQYPEINAGAYRAMFDNHAWELRERIDYGANPEQILATINQYLFTELAFVGNEANYYDPDNSYLNRVLDLRTGNPISLCLVYLCIARRLQLPIVGIGMPGHFVCRFQTSAGEWFIDAFNRGKLLTKADCVKYLLQSSHGFAESHLAPVSGRRILLRICLNLHHIYLQLEQPEQTAQMQRYLVALSN